MNYCDKNCLQLPIPQIRNSKTVDVAPFIATKMPLIFPDVLPKPYTVGAGIQDFYFREDIKSSLLKEITASDPVTTSSSNDKANIVEAITNIATSLIDKLFNKLEFNIGFNFICKHLGIELKFETQIKYE